MLVAYSDGKPVPEVTAELQAVLDRWAARGVTVELRVASAEPAPADDFWGKELTEEEIERISSAPGAMPLAEFWKKMGVR